MKKIISMGIASAVLALTAIAASADIKANGPEKAESGKTVTVTITITAEITDCGFYVSATGLEAVGDPDTTTTDGSMIVGTLKADGSVLVGGCAAAGKTIKAGTVLATITYTVTAENGTDAVVEVKNAEGYEEALQNHTIKVEVEETSKPEESKPEESKPEESKPEESGSGEGGSDVPATGVALAVVPAVLAGAAVVVAKKRK